MPLWVRGHSTTTWTEFCHFWPPLPLSGQFLYPERGQKQPFFDSLPHSSCPRSYWMPPMYTCSIFDWMVYVCGSMATTKSENIHQCNMSQTCQETDFLPNGYQNVLVVIWALLHTELLLLVYVSMTSAVEFFRKGPSGSRFLLKNQFYIFFTSHSLTFKRDIKDWGLF